mmetsp:Transcript_70000/g.152720  ORF Transcript_70000/g.152720 Transcript_70000/m.152720 type:complete len:139 (+) Transcript_70000:714-1130(+)
MQTSKGSSTEEWPKLSASLSKACSAAARQALGNDFRISPTYAPSCACSSPVLFLPLPLPPASASAMLIVFLESLCSQHPTESALGWIDRFSRENRASSSQPPRHSPGPSIVLSVFHRPRLRACSPQTSGLPFCSVPRE